MLNINIRQILLILFFGIFTCLNSFAGKLPNQESVPGGIAKIALNLPVQNNSTSPEAYFQDKKLLVYPHNGYYYALVGLPLKLNQGSYKIEYTDNYGNFKTKKFEVKNKKYKVSRIKIKNKNMVNPDPKTQDRIINDLNKIQSAVNNYSDNLPNSLILKSPVQGVPTTSFGAKRVINGQSKNPHTGMDIAAATSTPVNAAADGKVVLADNFYLSGNMVAIDHGRGLVTMYAHLNEILVKSGDIVKTGEKIGKVGSTGRVTGPHLHWTVRLNETPVNPDLFLEKIKSKAKAKA